MWVEYWDGDIWKPVDPGNNIFSPGALYVALGRGAAEFVDLRSDVASFLDRAFSGVSFDLVEATDRGAPLSLAHPRSPGGDDMDTTVFNAVMAQVPGGSRGGATDPGRGDVLTPPHRCASPCSAWRCWFRLKGGTNPWS